MGLGIYGTIGHVQMTLKGQSGAGLVVGEQKRAIKKNAVRRHTGIRGRDTTKPERWTGALCAHRLGTQLMVPGSNHRWSPLLMYEGGYGVAVWKATVR